MKSTEKLDLLNRVCTVLNEMGHHLSVSERQEMIERVGREWENKGVDANGDTIEYEEVE